MSNTFESNVEFESTIEDGGEGQAQFRTRPSALRRAMSEQEGITVFQLMAVRFRDEQALTHKTLALLIEAEHVASTSNRSDEWLRMSSIVILASHFLALPTPGTPFEAQAQAKSFAKLVKHGGVTVEDITNYLQLDD